MLGRNLFSSCLIGVAAVTTAVTIVSPSRANNALLPPEVATIAKSTVVQIQSDIAGSGSGVIIGQYREGKTNVYVVLTASHVVQRTDSTYTVITPPPETAENKIKQREKIKIVIDRDIQKFPNVDLAIVKFRSDRNYKTATLGDSNYTKEGAGVYIAGFPKPGGAIKVRAFQFTGSMVSSRLDADLAEGEQENVDGGYAIVYTANTRAGMSGGPVFDVAGRVVGIHGKGDREIKVIPGESQESTNYITGDKTGFNLGIPIRTFMKLMPNYGQLGAKFDQTEPGLFPGGGTIALRGGRKVPVSNIKEINITEEDAGNDVIEQPENNLPSNTVKPENIEPSQPIVPQSSPNNSNPSQPVKKPFF